MAGEWDKTKSYTYGEPAYYNGYTYFYVNQSEGSVVGLPPNEGTYSMTYKGETKQVRSWTIFEASGAAPPSQPMNTYTQPIKGIRGLPSDATPAFSPPRYDYMPSLWPYRKKSNNIDDVGVPETEIESLFPQGEYFNDGNGYNVELNHSFSSNQFSYNIAEMIGSNRPATDKPYPSASNAFTIHSSQGISSDDPSLANLNVWAYPALDPYISIRPTASTMAEFMAIFNTFGREIRLFFVAKLYNYDGTFAGETPPEEIIAKTGPYRERFWQELGAVKTQKSVERPVDSLGRLGSVVFSLVGEWQQVEMLGSFTD